MEPHPHRHHYRAIILTLFVGFALITISLIFYFQRNGSIQEPNAANTVNKKPIPTSIPITPTKTLTGVKFTLEADGASFTYKKDADLTIKVYGESNNNSVLGYDVVLSRALADYDVVSAASLLPEFTLLKFVKDDKVTITGILKPSITEKIVLKKTPVAEIVIRPKRAVSLPLTVLVNAGTSTTKIISSSTDTSTVKLPIDDPYTLRLDISQ